MPSFKDFYFPSSTGKNTVHARICLPDTAPRGIVQVVHGISEHIGRYEEFMLFLAENGFIAVGNDHLGHGLTAREPEERGFFCESSGWAHAVADLDRLRKITCAKYPGLPVIFFGHSMGSFLTRSYLITYPDIPAAAVICGTAHSPAPAAVFGYYLTDAVAKRRGARYVSETINAIVFGNSNKSYDTVRTEFDWLSRDEEVVDKYIADPMCGGLATVGLFRDMLTGIMYITEPANLRRMNRALPVLFIAGTGDPVGDYGDGVKRAAMSFIKAGMRDVGIKLYKDARHELLNELNKREVMEDVLSFIEKSLPKE